MIRKNKSGCYKITLPIYPVSFYLALSNEQAAKMCDDVPATGAGLVQEFADGGPPLVVIIDRSTGVIAHEVLHVALILMYMLGINPSYHDQEPMAYLVGYITEQVYKCMEREDKNDEQKA